MMGVSTEDLRSDLRAMLNDSVASRNILLGKEHAYSDAELDFFLKMALRDLNSGGPRTNYSLETFPDPDLLIIAGMIFSFISEGVLQLRNHIDYNDAGLSLGLFNKTAGYQGWAGFLLQTYLTNKVEFKRGVIANSPGAGFIGIASPFSHEWGWN